MNNKIKELKELKERFNKEPDYKTKKEYIQILVVLYGEILRTSNTIDMQEAQKIVEGSF